MLLLSLLGVSKTTWANLRGENGTQPPAKVDLTWGAKIPMRDGVKLPFTNPRRVLQIDGDGLVYHSEPLSTATEISGYARAELWMAIDVPDTDFNAALYAITPDGRSIFLTEDRIRARYRTSLREARPVSAGEVYRYVFDGFTFFSWQLEAGTRIRFVITSPNSIYVQKNYNAGGVVAHESGNSARIARVQLYQGPDYPSFVELPLGPTP